MDGLAIKVINEQNIDFLCELSYTTLSKDLYPSFSGCGSAW